MTGQPFASFCLTRGGESPTQRPYKAGKIIWPGLAKATTGSAWNSKNLLQLVICMSHKWSYKYANCPWQKKRCPTPGLQKIGIRNSSFLWPVSKTTNYEQITILWLIWLLSNLSLLQNKNWLLHLQFSLWKCGFSG